jgi:hypothetical protein
LVCSVLVFGPRLHSRFHRYRHIRLIGRFAERLGPLPSSCRSRIGMRGSQGAG